MKILHILDHSLPLHSGYTFRSQNIFRTQLKRGWQPVVITSPKHEENFKGTWEKQEKIGGISYYRTGAISRHRFPLEYELRLMAALGRRIQEVAEMEKPDLVHAHSPVLNAIPALRIGHKLGIPVVYEIRAFWEDAAVDHGTYGEHSWKYKLVKKIETMACKKADQVAILCNGLKNDLVQRGISPDKVTPVFNGVNPDDFKPCGPDKEYMSNWNIAGRKVIGFIGSFYRYEGLDLMVEAFAQVADKHNAVLLLVGGGEMEPELKAQIKRLNIEKKIVMPGRIPHERIPGVYAMADILVYPRYSMRLTELVTPLKPLEAMAMNKALIASDVGGHRELIRHGKTGLLFPAGNTSELVKSLERLLDDCALCQSLGKQGGTWVKKEHTWDKTTAVYSEIYDRALGKGVNFA